MAELTLAVEDSSSLIEYNPAGAWTNPSDDPLSQSYSGQSYHSSSVQGATATIHFNGTGINVFGANRPAYGSFQLKVDGNVVSQGQASASQPEFNRTIASSGNLPYGLHTAVLENTSSAPIDLDMVQIISQIGPPGSQLNTTTYDDSNPAMVYLPSPNVWRTNRDPSYSNGTLHYSNDSNAAVTLSWDDGEAFSIWTTAAPDHRDFDIEVDGKHVASCSGGSASTSALRENVLMHFQTDLGPGPHTLKIIGGQGGPFLDVDAVRVYSSTGGTGLTSIGANGSSGLTIGAIVGIVVGALLFMLLILGAVIFILRRKGILAFGNKRRSASSDRLVLKPSSLRDVETGLNYVEKERRSSFGPVPLSTTSSFFAPERMSQFPTPRIPLDGEYYGSLDSPVPPLPPMPESRPQSVLPPPPTAHRPESATSDILDAYFKSNRETRGNLHQSMAGEVSYESYPGRGN